MQYGAVFGGKLCSPWTEHACQSQIYDEQYCFKYSCNDNIPKQLLTLINQKYPGTFERKNIDKIQSVDNELENSSENDYENKQIIKNVTDFLQNNLKMYNEKIEKKIKISNENMTTVLKNNLKMYSEKIKSKIKIIETEIKDLKSGMNTLTPLMQKISSSALFEKNNNNENKNNLSYIFLKKKFREFENDFSDLFEEKFKKQKSFFLSLFNNVSRDLNSDHSLLKNVENRLPGKFYFDSLYINARDSLNLMRQKTRVRVTLDHEKVLQLVKEIRKEDQACLLNNSASEPFLLEYSTFNIIEIIKEYLKKLVISVQSADHLRLLNNLYRCQCPCV